MARVGDGKTSAWRVVRYQDCGRHRVEPRRFESPVHALEDLAFVDGVDAAEQVRVHRRAHGGDGLAVAGDIGQTDSGEESRATHRQVVDVATAGAAARSRVQHPSQSRKYNPLIDRCRASTDFSADQSSGELRSRIHDDTGPLTLPSSLSVLRRPGRGGLGNDVESLPDGIGTQS